MCAVLGDIPELADAGFAVAILKQMAGRKLANAPERGLRIGDIAEIKILEQALGIDVGQLWRNRENSLDLGAEQQTSLMHGIMQRLLSQPVARQQQRLLSDRK